jgi:hypothetical protein
VKRIRRDSHVRIAPCSARGVIRGATTEAEALIDPDTAVVEELLARKYGWMYHAYMRFSALSRKLRRQPTPTGVTIKITPARASRYLRRGGAVRSEAPRSIGMAQGPALTDGCALRRLFVAVMALNRDAIEATAIGVLVTASADGGEGGMQASGCESVGFAAGQPGLSSAIGGRPTFRARSTWALLRNRWATYLPRASVLRAA